MKIIYSPIHLKHKPPHEIFNGNREQHAEMPDRIENIKQALGKRLQLKTIQPQNFTRSWVGRVHRKDYVDFIKNCGQFKLQGYRYPSVFHYGVASNRPKNELAQLGFYSFDLYTPVSQNIWEIALNSVMLAFTAADLVKKGDRYAYALCRPPGHHAEPAQMGGYCYFNNAAVAANYLSTFGKVAILDIDFHHGNGMQHIFYERSDVLTISIHADPKVKFPFFSGFKNETGSGAGKGYNINFPLPLGTNDTKYHQVLITAIKIIEKFKPKFLVVPVGYDTHREDPIGGFFLTTDYYRQIGQTIKSLNLPIVLVQEGGYNTKLLGLNAVSFVKGFIE